MMGVSHERIARNLEAVRSRIRAAAERVGRDPDGVLLVAVTKSVSVAEIRALLELGVQHLGENRVDAAAHKIQIIGHRPQWHMIGTLQRRRAADVPSLFDQVDSVDRLSLAEELHKRCQGRSQPLPVLIQVNVSGEQSKHGFAPDDVGSVLQEMSRLSGIRLVGLMTMAPLVTDPEAARPVFRRLRELASRHGLGELSMGMSNDFEVAIEEGATQVRIGSELYK